MLKALLAYRSLIHSSSECLCSSVAGKGIFSGGGGQFDLLGHPHGALRASSSFCSSLVESELIADIVVGKSL